MNKNKKTTNKQIPRYKKLSPTVLPVYHNKVGLMEHIRKNPSCYPYKDGNTTFCASKNWGKFISKYMRVIPNKPKYYEWIPQASKLPFYMDIEYYWHKEYNEPIKSLLKLFELFAQEKSHQLLDEELHWKISRATRIKTVDDKNYMYHSFHVVLDTKKNYFKSQMDIQIYIKNIIYWAQNNVDNDIVNHWKNTCVEHPKKKESPTIIDFNIYCKSLGARSAFRMPLSCKADGADILRPWDIFNDKKIDATDLANYFVTYPNRFEKSAQEITVPYQWEYNIKKILPPQIIKEPKSLSCIPAHLVKRAILHMARTCKNSKYIKNEISSSGDYIFKFLNHKCICPIHNRAHVDMTNNNYMIIYKPCSKSWYLTCYSSAKDGKPALKLNANLYQDSIIKWDYEYEDHDEIDCKSFPCTDTLDTGGTFLLQAQKGTGKTKSMNDFIADEIKKKPDVKILVLTYRISLATKYDHEFYEQGFGFHNYQNPIQSQANVDRMIVLIHSLHKCLNHKSDYTQEKYDIIIMDELYSILESWDDSNMGHKKQHLMLVFEELIKNCGYLYVMDAHLNNKLCVNTLSKLRDPEKFIAHRNPYCHDYSDYIVNWYEPKKREDVPMTEEIDKELWQNLFLSKLKEGKKLAFVSATKTMVNDMVTWINALKHKGDLPDDFKYLAYTSDTKESEKKKQLADVELYWSDVSVVLYSPTISAGTSYNLIDEGGFDEVFVYLQTPNMNTASYNTMSQMLFRIRRLNDKQFHIFYNNTVGKPYSFDEAQIEREVILNTETIFDTFGKPVGELYDCLDDKYRPRFDKNKWSWTLYIETVSNKCFYSKPKNFKLQIMSELKNSPSDYITPGRGMNWMDHSINIEPITNEAKIEIMENKIDKVEQIQLSDEKKYKLWGTTHHNEGLMTDETFDWVIERYKNNDYVDDKYDIMFKIKGIEMNLNINMDKVFLSGDIEIFKKLLNFHDLSIFQRQKDYLNHEFNIYGKIFDSFNNYYKFAHRKFKGYDFDLVQPLADQWQNGYSSLVGIREIFDILIIPEKYRHDLNGVKIERSQLEEILSRPEQCNRLFKLFKKFWSAEFSNKFNKDTSRYIETRNFLAEWYKQNPNKHLYEEIPVDKRDAFVESNRLMSSLDVFKKSTWKPKKTDKARKEFDAMCREGKWSCAQLDAVTPANWSVTILKHYLDGVFSSSIGYQFQQTNKKESFLEFNNKFNDILEFSHES